MPNSECVDSRALSNVFARELLPALVQSDLCLAGLIPSSNSSPGSDSPWIERGEKKKIKELLVLKRRAWLLRLDYEIRESILSKPKKS